MALEMALKMALMMALLLCSVCPRLSSPSSSFLTFFYFTKALLPCDFHVHFFCFCAGTTDTSPCWFFGSVAVSVARVGVTAGPVMEVGVPAVSIMVVGAAAGCNLIFRSKDLLFPWGHWAVLNMALPDRLGSGPSTLQWFVFLWNCHGDGAPFPNVLLVFLGSALVQTHWRFPLP